MSSGLASDEVAEDYKNSLEDLITNDRFQISNLTVIAKENTEHAMAISRVLENHIRTVGDRSSPTSSCSDPGLFVVRNWVGLFFSNACDVDTAGAETSCFICSRLDRQKCRDSLHVVPRPEHVPDLHERLHLGRLADAPETG